MSSGGESESKINGQRERETVVTCMYSVYIIMGCVYKSFPLRCDELALLMKV